MNFDLLVGLGLPLWMLFGDRNQTDNRPEYAPRTEPLNINPTGLEFQTVSAEWANDLLLTHGR